MTLKEEEEEEDGLLTRFEKAGNRGGEEVSSWMSYFVTVCIVIYSVLMYQNLTWLPFLRKR